jgi:hypothetical protein
LLIPFDFIKSNAALASLFVDYYGVISVLALLAALAAAAASSAIAASVPAAGAAALPNPNSGSQSGAVNHTTPATTTEPPVSIALS